MLVYRTHLEVNDSFNKEILVEMFIDWLNTTRNKIAGLDYHYEDSFEYGKDDRKLKIEDFKEFGIYALQFSTFANYKKNHFIVEILFSYKEQSLDLGFYKEIIDESRYIEQLSLPRIFVSLMKSPYIREKDRALTCGQPFFMEERELNELIEENLDYPLVVLYRYNLCLVSPRKLAERIIGNGRVVCVNVKSGDEANHLSLIYPGGDKEDFIKESSENALINKVSDHVRNYMLGENGQYYSFDELIRIRLKQENEENQLSNQEFEDYFREELQQLKDERDFYKEQYQELEKQYYELVDKKAKLEDEVNRYNEDALLILDQKDYQPHQQIVLAIIDKVLRNLNSHEVYRKRDILESIKRRNV